MPSSPPREEEEEPLGENRSIDRRTRYSLFILLEKRFIAKSPSPDFNSLSMSASELSGQAAGEEDFGFAECECCGLTEECTAAYVAAVRARYAEKWICGLCAEAVEEEICRSARLMSTEEALKRQMSFRSETFTATAEAGDHLIAVVRRLIRRSLDSPPRLLLSSSTASSRKIPAVSGRSANYPSDVGDVDLLEEPEEEGYIY